MPFSHLQLPTAGHNAPARSSDVSNGWSASALAPRERLDLPTILETVFDPREDRVVYELARARATGRSAAARFVAPRGAGISAAVAFVDARERLGQRHFVVAACDEASWCASADVLACLQPIRERFVLLVPGPQERSEDGCEAPVIAGLRQAGWTIRDLRQRPARDLAKALLMARHEVTPALLLLDASAAASATSVLGPQCTVEGAPRDGAALEASPSLTPILVRELDRRLARDRRLAVLVVSSDPLWRQLIRSSGAASVESVPGGFDGVAGWSTALVEAGCRLLIVLDDSQYALHRDSIWAGLCRQDAPVTLIVLERSPRKPRVCIPLPQVEHLILPRNLRAGEAARRLWRCVAAGRPTVLFVPEAPVATVDGPLGEKAEVVEEAGGLVPVAEGQAVSTAGEVPYAVSPQSAQSDQQEIERKRLRPEVLRWVQDYDRVGHRSLYLWRWCLHGIELTTFPDVRDDLRTHLHDTKLLSVILCVLFDDVADRQGRAELLEGLIQAAVNRTAPQSVPASGEEQDYLDVTQRLWREYEARVGGYPYYPPYERLWRFDLLQFLNTMRYTHLVNSHPGLLNLTEHDVYTPHNMLMVSFSTLDLMCVPHFDTAELGRLREAMWHAQAMGRIGNVLSTWRRELAEADFSSGMFAGDPSVPASAKEQRLFEKWRWHRERCHAAARRVRSMNLDPVLVGHDRFLDMHLASAGRI